MAALSLQGQAALAKELREVAARRLRRDARAVGKLLRGVRPPIHLAREHPRACALADERGNCRDTQVRIHSSTGLDGSMVYNGPAHRAVPEPRC